LTTRMLLLPILLGAAPAAAQVPLLPLPHFYAGVQAGQGTRSAPRASDLPGERIGGEDKGVDFGGFAGVDLPVGILTYAAVEAEIGSSTGKTDNDWSVGGAPYARVVRDARWNWAATGRIGLTPLPGLAAYGIAGYGGEKVRETVTVNGAGERDAGWAKGLIYGAGARFVFAGTGVRVEYRKRMTDGQYDPEQVLAGVFFRF
jgi:opacity protein-like surface antigen